MRFQRSLPLIPSPSPRSTGEKGARFIRNEDTYCELPNIQDPAILIWLDADSNRKEHPNENLARELMELFTLGVGHYSELDVKESARAHTGWTVARSKFRSDENLHDADEKSILGKSGPWNGDDLLKILAEWTKRLGQDLFNPPNVFGWIGGRAWLTSRAMIGRANFATAISTGEHTAEKKPFDAKNLAERNGFTKAKEIGNFYAQLLLGVPQLPEYWSSLVDEPQKLVVTILSSPEAQIG